MTTSLPTIYPVGYAGTTLDFLQTKCERDGSVRLITGKVALPASTATSTIIGLLPFNAGFKIGYGSSLYFDDLDSSTNVTVDVGYTYYDSATGTSHDDAFVDSAATVPQSAGFITFTGSTGSSVGFIWTALGDGWITVTNNAATTTTGNCLFNIVFAYDASGVTNTQT